MQELRDAVDADLKVLDPWYVGVMTVSEPLKDAEMEHPRILALVGRLDFC